MRLPWLGDRLLAETTCPAPGCGARVDIAFGIAAFLAHHRPLPPRLRAWQVAPCAEQAGWFVLRALGAAAKARPRSLGCSNICSAHGVPRREFICPFG